MYKDRIVELRRVRAGDLAPAPLTFVEGPDLGPEFNEDITDCPVPDHRGGQDSPGIPRVVRHPRKRVQVYRE